MEEKELFEDYEHKVWQWTPRLYKIFGAAVAIQLFIFVVIGQFNLLQTRACDTIIANKVCQVIDAAYIGSTFLNDKDWVDQEYTKSEFKEMDTIFVDMTNSEPPFTYPEGYFALVNPEDLILPPTEDPLGNNEFSNNDPLGNLNPTPNPTPKMSDLADTKQKLPKYNPKPVKGNVDDKLFDFEDDKPKTSVAKQTTSKPPKISPSPSKTPDKDTTAGNGKDGKADPSASPTPEFDPVTFTPNKKPLNDLRDLVKEKVAKNEVDLKAPFSVTVDGVLTKEGKLDKDKTKFSQTEGDQKIVDLAKSAIEAINDSGMLQYLDKLGGKRLVATIQQDKDNMTVVIKSSIETEEKAKTLASGFKLLLATGKILRKGKDEEVLLNSATVTSQGKVFMLNFAVPQNVAQDLIQKQLKDESTTEETKPQSNGVGDAKNSNAKVGKL